MWPSHWICVCYAYNLKYFENVQNQEAKNSWRWWLQLCFHLLGGNHGILVDSQSKLPFVGSCICSAHTHAVWRREFKICVQIWWFQRSETTKTKFKLMALVNSTTMVTKIMATEMRYTTKQKKESDHPVRLISKSKKLNTPNVNT